MFCKSNITRQGGEGSEDYIYMCVSVCVFHYNVLLFPSSYWLSSNCNYFLGCSQLLKFYGKEEQKNWFFLILWRKPICFFLKAWKMVCSLLEHTRIMITIILIIVMIIFASNLKLNFSSVNTFQQAKLVNTFTYKFNWKMVLENAP